MSFSSALKKLVEHPKPFMSQAPFFVDNEVITIDRDGNWIADGIEISHEPTRKLFARNLFQDEKGYLIKIGRETKRIEVQDTAFFIHRVDGDPQSGYELWLNDESKVSLDPATLKYRPGRLSCTVMTRIGLQEAKFLRSAYFDVLRNTEEDSREYFLNFGGSRITLAKK